MAAQSVFRRGGDGTVPNSLDIARDTFTWLVTGPHPVSLNGRLFPGLPDRYVPLDEVRDRLLARRCAQATRDAVWAHLVLRSRTEGATWTVAAVGVALHALTSVAATLTDRFAGDPADVHAEVLRGFLSALSTIDLRPPRIMLRLRWAAYRSGYHALADALAGPTPVAPGFRSSPPQAPWGHPDLVLARAVADGVLTQTEAALIGATRLEQVPVADWAAQHQAGVWAVYKTRQRAELRLVAYLRDNADETDPTDPLTDQVPTAVALARPVTPDRACRSRHCPCQSPRLNRRRKFRAACPKRTRNPEFRAAGHTRAQPDLRRCPNAPDRSFSCCRGSASSPPTQRPLSLAGWPDGWPDDAEHADDGPCHRVAQCSDD